MEDDYGEPLETIKNGLTLEQEDNIRDLWETKFIDGSIIVEKETFYLSFDYLGYILCHITPMQENPSDAYYTIWKNDDFKTNKKVFLYQYTLMFNPTFDPNDELSVEELGEDDALSIAFANNLVSITDEMINHWMYHRT